jgi:predicted fused transcriptional regulator/phosphomethylpyrimidine kinase
MTNDKEKALILGDMVSALNELEDCPQFTLIMPEVRVNLVYALPGAKTPQEVAAVPGRITTVRGRPRAAALPNWGASDHMARFILEVCRYEPRYPAGINFRYESKLAEITRRYAEERGWPWGWIDRTQEPEEVQAVDRRSIPWKVQQLLAACGSIPRLF